MGFSEKQKQILQDHYRNPRNKAPLPTGEESAVLDNPSCGDRVALSLNWDEENRVSRILFDGVGCSVSMASASILTEMIMGLSRRETAETAAKIRRIFAGEEAPEELEALGDIAALRELLNFPVRLKCAALAWDTLEAVLKKEES
jgi:nitrogen fixation NifU-like protein